MREFDRLPVPTGVRFLPDGRTIAVEARCIELGGSGADYLRVLVPAAGSQPVHPSLAGRRGGNFAAGVQPQLTVLRIR